MRGHELQHFDAEVTHRETHGLLSTAELVESGFKEGLRYPFRPGIDTGADGCAFCLDGRLKAVSEVIGHELDCAMAAGGWKGVEFLPTGGWKWQNTVDFRVVFVR